MSSANLNSRVTRLEAKEPAPHLGKPFLWPSGRSLADSLADAGLTLADKPLFPIVLSGVKPGKLDAPPCPLYLRDRHLLDA